MLTFSFFLRWSKRGRKSEQNSLFKQLKKHLTLGERCFFFLKFCVSVKYCPMKCTPQHLTLRRRKSYSSKRQHRRPSGCGACCANAIDSIFSIFVEAHFGNHCPLPIPHASDTAAETMNTKYLPALQASSTQFDVYQVRYIIVFHFEKCES